MKLYCFDGERESIEFDTMSIPENKDKFQVVIDEINKQTLLQKSLLNLGDMGYVTFSKANGERIPDTVISDMKAKVKHNLSELEILSTELGIKLTTKKELADMIGKEVEKEQENGN